MPRAEGTFSAAYAANTLWGFAVFGHHPGAALLNERIRTLLCTMMVQLMHIDYMYHCSCAKPCFVAPTTVPDYMRNSVPRTAFERQYFAPLAEVYTRRVGR